MDGQHRQPRDSDRKPIRQQITRAVRDGRISAADGEIRLANVDAAQSIGELGLIVRDLDQLDTAFPTTPPPVSTATGGPARTLPLTVLVLVLAVGVIAVAAAGLVVFSSTGGSSGSVSSGELPEPVPIGPTVEEGETDDAGPEPGGDPAASPSGASYRLGAAGFRLFLDDYRQRFGTSEVVDLTFYDDYVIVRVPVPGRQRNTGWRYADGVFTEFGPTAANFPGAAVLDAAALDVAKLVRNIATATRTLGVEDGTVSHIGLSYRPATDDVPSVNIYVSNTYAESGYLATTLDGRVERAYPYGG